jgi:TENA/THI-4/PQQC family protein
LKISDAGLPDGLWSGTGGFLRPSVGVVRLDGYIRVSHSIWQLDVPDRFTEADRDVLELLDRRKPLRDVTVRSQKAENLFRILAHQGCFTYDGTKERYSLDEVRYVATALVAQWYGLYYSHPFWNKLGGCQLSIPQLFAWALRTYHLSRSAGPTAARGVVHSPDTRVRNAFSKSAIEEYSHCETYYLPVHGVFGLEEGWIKKLLPLPSSTAFDQQMSVIAEDDWLAHTVVAYFQEYTAAFRENAFELYDRLEAAYALDGFFSGWKNHIGYDVDQTHCDDFGDLLTGDDEVSRERLLESLEAASNTVQFLISAIDEVDACKANMSLKEFRVSPSLATVGAQRSSILGGVDDIGEPLGKVTWAEMCTYIAQVAFRTLEHRRRQLSEVLAVVLSRPTLSDLVMRALSRTSSHDSVVASGCILEEAQRLREVPASVRETRLSALAVTNFLRESVGRPEEFVFLLVLALRCAKLTQGRDEDTLSSMAAICESRFANTQLETGQRARFADIGLQFIEMCIASLGFRNIVPNQDMLFPEYPV